MKKWIAGPAIAGLLLVGSASTVDAATAPTQEETTTDDDDGSKAGLWGLLGLAGLAGLAGLKRRDNDRVDYDRRGSGATSQRIP